MRHRNRNPWWMWPLILLMLGGTIVLVSFGWEIFLFMIEDVSGAIKRG